MRTDPTRIMQLSEDSADRRRVFVALADGTDFHTPETGLSPTATLCKADESSFSAIAGSVAEIGTTGVYAVDLAAADLDTLGEALLMLADAAAETVLVPLVIERIRDELHEVDRLLTGKTELTVDTGVLVVKDNDGSTTLLTLTPTSSAGVRTLTPS